MSDAIEVLRQERFKVFMAICGRHEKWSLREIAVDTGLTTDKVYRHWVWLDKKGVFKKANKIIKEGVEK